MTARKRLPQYEVPDDQRHEYFSVSEIAKGVGRSVVTVKRWISAGKIEPVYWHRLPGRGNNFEWLYDMDDLRNFLNIRDGLKPGPPPRNPDE